MTEKTIQPVDSETVGLINKVIHDAQELFNTNSALFKAVLKALQEAKNHNVALTAERNHIAQALNIVREEVVDLKEKNLQLHEHYAEELKKVGTAASSVAKKVTLVKELSKKKTESKEVTPVKKEELLKTVDVLETVLKDHYDRKTPLKDGHDT